MSKEDEQKGRELHSEISNCRYKLETATKELQEVANLTYVECTYVLKHTSSFGRELITINAPTTEVQKVLTSRVIALEEQLGRLTAQYTSWVSSEQ